MTDNWRLPVQEQSGFAFGEHRWPPCTGVATISFAGPSFGTGKLPSPSGRCPARATVIRKHQVVAGKRELRLVDHRNAGLAMQKITALPCSTPFMSRPFAT